jgi:hypothetical protein
MGRYKGTFETDDFISFYALVFLHCGRLAVEMQNFARQEC